MDGMELYFQEAEQAVVGCLLLEKELIKECTIEPKHLYMSKLRKLFLVIKQLNEKGKPIDLVAIIDQLGRDNLVDIGGVTYISALMNSVPTTANFQFYQDLVKEYYQKRKAHKIAQDLMEDAYSDNISKTVQDAIQKLITIEESTSDDDTGEIHKGLIDLYSDCEKDVGEISGISSGFQELDQLTGGFQESDFIVVGARPSVGKTALALNIAYHAAKHHIAMVFSLEMGTKQLLTRIVSFVGGINTQKMRNPKRYFVEEDWNNYTKAFGKMTETNLRIFDRPSMDIPYIWSKVRKMRRKHEKEKLLVVVDYLQLIVGDPAYKQNRQAEISEISRALKHMARELNVVVIALSQLSRGVESRNDKRPILSDLRESGQIEQDADLIAFLYRDDYYHQNSKQQNTMEVILAKHRNGPIGTVKLGINSEVGRFWGMGEVPM